MKYFMPTIEIKSQGEQIIIHLEGMEDINEWEDNVELNYSKPEWGQ